MVMLTRDTLNLRSKDRLKSTKDSNKLPKYINPMLNIYLQPKLLYLPKDLTLVDPLSLPTHLTQHPHKYHMLHHRPHIPHQEHQHEEIT